MHSYINSTFVYLCLDINNRYCGARQAEVRITKAATQSGSVLNIHRPILWHIPFPGSIELQALEE